MSSPRRHYAPRHRRACADPRPDRPGVHATAARAGSGTSTQSSPQQGLHRRHLQRRFPDRQRDRRHPAEDLHPPRGGRQRRRPALRPNLSGAGHRLLQRPSPSQGGTGLRADPQRGQEGDGISQLNTRPSALDIPLVGSPGRRPVQ
jgi:hypothetical protein